MRLASAKRFLIAVKTLPQHIRFLWISWLGLEEVLR
jgi:hypothetical protein